VLSLLPLEQLEAVRTDLPGQIEHIVAYTGSAAVATVGYGLSRRRRLFLAVRRYPGIPPELLAWPKSVTCRFRSVCFRRTVRQGRRRPRLALSLCYTRLA